ncbi:TetR/AcrR family transcriptional regulator [Brucella oryzae]|uniref:TetR/AcrR family transcriptional regulator n=1 Tax=Brucella oryzae TaxID=335286 RepID=UPI0035BBF2A9
MGAMEAQTPKPPRKRDAADSKRRILRAALNEFATHGFAGARVDRIAEEAEVSKPMIYDYFGDKNALYAAALREAYVKIREAEKKLSLDKLSPDDAVRELVRFTMNHFRRNPWFISMLTIENMQGGKTIRTMSDMPRIQSVLVDRVSELLERGKQSGDFRKKMNPRDFYVFVASLCYFPISNTHTLRAVFGLPIDNDWLDRRCEEASEMLLSYLKRDVCR